jgi:3-deoxy-D-manno-octulosonic-acid transferase
LYRVLVRLALPLAVPAIALRDRLTGKRRPPVAERLLRTVPPVPPGGLWLQAVSVGEVEVARRLVAELGRVRGSPPVLVTATTATGLALARRTLATHATVLPCPLDLPGPVSRLLDAASPRGVVLVETELWPEMLYQAGVRQVPVAVVNARLSPDSFARYRRAIPLLRPLLEPLTKVLARDESDGERFVALGVPAERVEVAGNVKYDLEPDATPLEWEGRLDAVAGGRPVLVAGSTMDGEEQLVVDALDRLAVGGARPVLVLAPRHPERFDAVADLLAARGLTVARRSSATWPDDAGVLLLDTIGELSRAYRLGRAAFIGGSLVPTGGHNPLEPAVWGVPVATGPHVFNFHEVYAEMTAAGAAVVVDGAGGLAEAWGRWLAEPDAARRAGSRGRRVVEGNRGATARTVAALLEMIAP